MPYKEGKIGLKNYKIGSSFFLIFCFVTSNLLAQFNLNGFYRLQKFQTLPGYEKIFQTDFKFNKLTDLVFYTSDKNNVVLHPSEAKFQFDSPINKFFFFPITSIEEILNTKDENYHIFISRNERLAGLVSFTRYGTMQILNMKKFDSFPSRIVVDNFDRDKSLEAVVFGSAFDGLTILNRNSYKLDQINLLQGQSFSEVVTLDLDFDGYKDILAKDLLDNSLTFLYNNHMGSFEAERTWAFDSTFENLSIIDFNKDSFYDLVYLSENGITVCYGDSVYSFRSKSFWPTVEPSDIRLINDFNNDGNYDFLSYNKASGNLNVKLDTSIYETDNWFTLLQDTSITDIQLLKGYKNSLLLLSDKGAFYTLSSLTKADSSFWIPYIPSSAYIPFLNSGNKIGIAELDSVNLNLNLTYSLNGLLDKKKIIPAAERFTKITSVSGNDQTYFVLYSDSLELFQLIDAELNSSSSTDFKIYADYPIIDLVIAIDSSSVYPSIYTLVAKDDSIGIIKFRYKDFHYISSRFDKIAENVLDAKLKYDSELVIEYVTASEDSISLSKHHNFDNRSDIISTISFPIDSVKAVSLSDNYCLVTQPNNQFLINTDNYKELVLPEEINGAVTDISICSAKKKKLLAKTISGELALLNYSKNENKLSLANYIVSGKVDLYFCTTIQGKKYLVYKLIDDDLINFSEFK